ncbi:hypothetical protein BgiBS90_036193, partial [Biomphalaria glabrata]
MCSSVSLQNETCARVEQMYTSVEEMTSPELKTLNEVVETQSHEIRSYNGHASEDGAFCNINSKPYESNSYDKKCGDCYDFLNEYRITSLQVTSQCDQYEAKSEPA